MTLSAPLAAHVALTAAPTIVIDLADAAPALARHRCKRSSAAHGAAGRIALFAANAPVALRVALHLKERYGADWQQRVALLSIDDPEWAEFAGITTIRQPTYDIGYRAVEFLHERIEGARMPARDCLLPGEFIVRASTRRDNSQGIEWSVYRRSSVSRSRRCSSPRCRSCCTSGSNPVSASSGVT